MIVAGTLQAEDIAVAARSLGGGKQVKNILVVKLDHLGDFLIGLPALEQLRTEFPTARIRLVCGPWNRDHAIATGLVDEVRCYTYFPQNARNWDGRPVEETVAFKAAAEGKWDLAIDLRVDEDTHFLLKHADAAIRCGIGPRGRFPYLDILLPPELEVRQTSASQGIEQRRFGVDLFESAFPIRLRERHETGFRGGTGQLLNGPGIALPRGRFRVLFDCDLRGRGFGLMNVAFHFGVCADGQLLAEAVYSGGRTALIAGGPVAIDFYNESSKAKIDFRIDCLGRPLFGRFGFNGCRLIPADNQNLARLRKCELHTGEKLSLLVALIRERTRLLYPARPKDTFSISKIEMKPDQRLIVISPTSNSTLRDWPPSSYTALIGLLLERTDCIIYLTGASDQAHAIDKIIHPLRDHPRVVNLAGQLPWSELPALVRAADLVICNNSGIAHLAASLDARVLALYSASHQVEEWGPRGQFARVLTAQLPCAPCGHDVLSHCNYGHACMVAITPELVLDEAISILQATPPR